MLDAQQGQMFAPNKKAKHKVPDILSRSNLTQKRKHTDVKTNNGRKTNGKPNRMSKNSRKRPCIEISDSDDTNNDDDVYGNVPKHVEGQKLATNPPHIVLINALVQKCSRCNFKFTAPERHRPQDMVFKYLMHRLKPDGRGKMVPDTNRIPAYFHLRDWAYLHHLEELKNIEMDGIYI